MFRATNTSGTKSLTLCPGDGTATASIRFNPNGTSFFNSGNKVAIGGLGVSGDNLFQVHGDAIAVTWNTSSDYRLKEDINSVSNSIDKVKSLNPVKYKWKDSGIYKYGFLAHEIQNIIPELVNGEKDATQIEPAKYDEETGNLISEAQEKPVYQSVDYMGLIPILTDALQKAIQRIETLENQIQQMLNQ